jgi:GH24 family phage-related lysozyme (muramidase)
MSNLGEHSARNPIDLSRLDQISDPEVFDREYHAAIRSHLQQGGFLPPTEGVTVDAEDPEDTEGFFDSIINSVRAFAGSDSFEDPENRYQDKRFDFVAGSSRYSETMYRDRAGRARIGYDFNLDDPELREMARNVLGKSEAEMDAIASGEQGISARDSRVLYEARISRAERFIKNRFEDVPLGDNQRMALVSLAYQNEQLIGPNLTRLVNEGDWEGAEEEIRQRSNGLKLEDIANRRNMEADMFRGMTQPEEAPPGEEGFSLSSLFGFNQTQAPTPEAASELAPDTSLVPQPRPNMPGGETGSNVPGVGNGESEMDPTDYGTPYDQLAGYSEVGARMREEIQASQENDVRLVTADGEEVESANGLLSMVPSHVRMVIEDVVKTQLGIDQRQDLKTSDFFSDEELGFILSAVRRVSQANGGATSGAVEYTGQNSGYDQGTDNVTFAGDDLSIIGGDVSDHIQKTLGQFNFRINDQGELIITDEYDFNNAAEMQERYPTQFSRIMHIMSEAGKTASGKMAGVLGMEADSHLGLYGLARTAAALFGSVEGEGARFEMNLGVVDLSKVE